MRAAMIPIRLLGQRLKRVFGRGAWQRPLQRVGMLVPIVVLGHALTVTQGVEYHTNKEQERRKLDKRTDR